MEKNICLQTLATWSLSANWKWRMLTLKKKVVFYCWSQHISISATVTLKVNDDCFWSFEGCAVSSWWEFTDRDLPCKSPATTCQPPEVAGWQLQITILWQIAVSVTKKYDSLTFLVDAIGKGKQLCILTLTPNLTISLSLWKLSCSHIIFLLQSSVCILCHLLSVCSCLSICRKKKWLKFFP